LFLSFYRPSSWALGVEKKQDGMLDFIDSPMDNTVGDDDLSQTSPEMDELADLVRCTVRAADGRKAENIVALRVSGVTTVTRFMVRNEC
jgi:hypothetical protein